MIERYEATRSRGEASLLLIFPEGAWESLPFEVRLLRPWYGREVFAHTGITMHRRGEIARRGYCIAAVRPLNLEKHVTEGAGDLLLNNQPELARQQPSFGRRAVPCRILIPIFRQIPPSRPERPDVGSIRSRT